MPLTQTQLTREVAAYADVDQKTAKAVLDALEQVELTEIGNAEKVKIGGIVQLTVAVRAATKARPGRNPAGHRQLWRHDARAGRYADIPLQTRG